jgi:hypothetical protein
MRPGESLHGMSDYAKANIVCTPQTNRKSDHGGLHGAAMQQEIILPCQRPADTPNGNSAHKSILKKDLQPDRRFALPDPERRAGRLLGCFGGFNSP